MNKINKALFGTDYEYFVVNEKGDVASAIGYIGGSKQEPLSIGEGCFRQSDNILAEANHPPVDNLEDWLYYFKYSHKQMSKILAPHGLTLFASTAQMIKDEYLEAKGARTFGCQPSFCAYPTTPKIKRDPKSNLRTAGVHVHVGIQDKGISNIDDLNRFMRIMDQNLGAPSVLLDPDRVRRQMYGQAGEFRYAKRGEWMVFEYRSLGSFLLSKEEYLTFIYTQTEKSIQDYNNGVDPPMELQVAINNYDEQACINLMGKENYELVLKLQNEVVNV